VSGFKFTNNWFEQTAKAVWDELLPKLNPRKVLEIGSYEGASACYLIDKLASQNDIELHCVDTWAGGVEHTADETDMSKVEGRFLHNISLATQQAKYNVELYVHKEPSDLCLAKLLARGERSSFDFIYVDGSHQAPDVLSDAVLGFKLLRTGGVMVFDDYLWFEDLPGGRDPLRSPKPAIDAFVNLNIRKLEITAENGAQQITIMKTAK